MKISVNTTAAKNRKAALVNNVLKMAKEQAEKGFNSFTYHFNEDERKGLPPPYFNLSVEIESEGSVKCAYRGSKGQQVTYLIS
jgi:hypothetical protein